MGEGKVFYFEEGGKHNTEKTLMLARQRAEELGIRDIVIASVSGYSGRKALEVFGGSGLNVIIVGIAERFHTVSFDPEVLKELKEKGFQVLFSRDVKYEYPEIVQDAFRRFCEGMKVAVEVVLIATEAGLLSPGKEVIGVGGSGILNYEKGGGVDTAIVMEAIKSADFLRLEDFKEHRRKIKEVICKPR